MTEKIASPRVLICRLSAIGDVIHTLPVATALKQAIPDCHIGWVVQGAAAKLLAGHPSIDVLHVVRRGWLRDLKQALQLRRDLRHQQYEVALDPQSLTKSAMAAWLSNAPLRIGFAAPQGREFAPALNTHRVSAAKDHVVDKYLELLEPLGITQPAVDFALPHWPAAEAAVDVMLAELGLQGERFAVLNPGAGWDSKLWPHLRYAETARQLAKTSGLSSLVVWAGDRERQWAEEIVAASDGCARLAPDTSLTELATLLRRATIFVGSDTGPLHLAAAVDTPCVGLYGPTRPSICGPYGIGHLALQAFYQGGTSAERRGTDNRAMQAIGVEEVVAACQRALSGETLAAEETIRRKSA